MASWKENAWLRRERDGLLDDRRSRDRKLERTEFVASQAHKWRRDAEGAASAQAGLKGAMASYRTSMARLQEESRKLKEESKKWHAAESECKRLRAELDKLNGQKQGAESAQSRLEHARLDLASV
eukprot:2790071-Pleurochrysis_carterae.AAC.1